MVDFTIQLEKIEQAISILKEKDVDCWLTFVRETAHNSDPALPLISPANVTWHTALIITSKGDKIAIAGRYEVVNFERMGIWDEPCLRIRPSCWRATCAPAGRLTRWPGS